MALPLVGAAMAAIAPELAKHGLDVLSGIFRGPAHQSADKVSKLIREKTGINVLDVADGKVTPDQWIQLKEFELAHHEDLLGYRQQLEVKTLQHEALHTPRTTPSGAAPAPAQAQDPFITRSSYYYAFFITGMTFVFIAAIILMPPADKSPAWRVVDTVLGFLLGVGVSSIVQFFFGTSMSSRQKDAQMRELSEQLAALRAQQQARKGEA